jgi:hypothetical protein
VRDPVAPGYLARTPGRGSGPRRSRTPGHPDRIDHDGDAMFLFFSNRLGCAGSLLLSVVVTAVLILVLSR